MADILSYTLERREGQRHCEGGLERSERWRHYGYCRWIKVKEVKGVIRCICRVRTADPDEILMDF